MVLFGPAGAKLINVAVLSPMRAVAAISSIGSART